METNSGNDVHVLCLFTRKSHPSFLFCLLHIFIYYCVYQNNQDDTMSSLAAARADNFYNPPDWDPAKESRNSYNKSNGALGKRANKLKSDGILIIRFEMPFPVWCGGCNHLIGKGVRFNAEKKKVGMYHSTTIWSFRMKSPCCHHDIEVHTDPKNCEYLIVSGAQRKSQGGGDDVVVVDPQATDRPRDAIGRLEVSECDKKKALEKLDEIVELKEQSYDRYKNDVDRNRDLRRAMRIARREEHGRRARRDALGLSKDITLQPETRLDVIRASAVDFGRGKARDTWKTKRKKILSQDIFGSSAQPSCPSSPLNRIVKRRRALNNIP